MTLYTNTEARLFHLNYLNSKLGGMPCAAPKPINSNVIKNGFLEMSEIHEIVKRQFDKQAQNFSNWSVTKNIEYQKAYFDFCEISSQDTLLDFACGTGEYAVYAAAIVKFFMSSS